MCASSCWNLLTRVSPVSAPDASLRCKTPKSAILIGSSRYERSRRANMRQCPGQFIGFNANLSFSISMLNMFSYINFQYSIVYIVPADIPKLSIIHVWSDYFRKSALPVFRLLQFNQCIVNSSSIGGEETWSWTELVKEKQFLFLALTKNTIPSLRWSLLEASAINFS